MFPLMKDPVSFHPIIYTDLKNITPMFILIDMNFHIFFNAQMEFREKNQPEKNGIDSLM